MYLSLALPSSRGVYCSNTTQCLIRCMAHSLCWAFHVLLFTRLEGKLAGGKAISVLQIGTRDRVREKERLGTPVHVLVYCQRLGKKFYQSSFRIAAMCFLFSHVGVNLVKAGTPQRLTWQTFSSDVDAKFHMSHYIPFRPVRTTFKFKPWYT